METMKDRSYGVVPVCKVGGEWHVLLINQISYKGSTETFWTFPKGHPEEDELPTDAALRELQEETGITDVTLIEKAVFEIEYTFTHEGARIEKTVAYYLGRCATSDVVISQPEEIAELRWCTFKEAMEQLTHKNAQRVLVEAGQFISKHIDYL